MNSMLYLYMRGAEEKERVRRAIEESNYFLPFLKKNHNTGCLSQFIQTNEFKISQRDIKNVVFEVADIKVSLTYDPDTNSLSTPAEHILRKGI